MFTSYANCRVRGIILHVVNNRLDHNRLLIDLKLNQLIQTVGRCWWLFDSTSMQLFSKLISTQISINSIFYILLFFRPFYELEIDVVSCFDSYDWSHWIWPILVANYQDCGARSHLQETFWLADALPNNHDLVPKLSTSILQVGDNESWQ